MPWGVTILEDVRRSFCQAVLESEESMSRVCRGFGISRKTGYKWLRRYEQAGEKGLSDRRRKPRHRPLRASAALEALVIAFKQQYPYWGPRKLHRLVYEDHPEAERVGISTFARILDRHGLVIPRTDLRRSDSLAGVDGGLAGAVQYAPTA